MIRTKVVRILSLAMLLTVALAAGNVAASPGKAFPSVIPLPNGWQPEGIVSGYGSTFYAGSLAGSGIYKGDFRTGEGDVLPESPGGPVVGIDFDERSNSVFAAGGPTGEARVYDGSTGEVLATYSLATGMTFINDVIVTKDAAYVADSFNAVLYRLPLGPGGSLPNPTDVETLPLSGDWMQVAGFNANGIDATSNGKTLVVVNSTFGTLYTVDPDTGEASLIDLGGGSVQRGDGVLLDGKTLYVVRNTLNQIAVVDLDQSLEAGEIVRTITDPGFRVPTTVTEHGSSLYVVNARFDTPPASDTEYEIIKVSK